MADIIIFGSITQLNGLWQEDFSCPVPDLWMTLAGDYFVGKLSAMSQLTTPTQPSIPGK